MHTNHISVSHTARTTRRGLLLASGFTAAGLALPALAQSGEPIKLGIVFPKQGTFAQLGEGAANAAVLTLEMAGGRILGRPAQTTWLDEPNPQTAQQNMQKLVDEEKVAAVLGGASGATALALSALARRTKTPLITISGAAVLTGKDCNRYTFRSNAPAPVAVSAITPAMLERGKRWYFLITDYAYGHDVYNAFKAALDAAGGTQVGYDRMPLGTTDFSAFILKIRQARPDVVATALSGNELPTFLKQYAEFGMRNGAPVVSPIITDTDNVAAGPQASGLYGKVWHHSDPNNSPEDRAFTEAYRRKHGVPPHSNALLAAVSMRLLLAAIQQAGSTSPEAIVRGLETVRLQDGAFPLYFREWDHQLMRRILVLRVRNQVTDLWDALEIVKQVPETPAGLDALYGTQAQSECRLGEV
ncbi:MAG: ABC transporter substrate-binding protein [Acetobacteraceae bacterium]|nr:ABC transporter substrate-binding protein [Acetobacteraceae bacterium]